MKLQDLHEKNGIVNSKTDKIVRDALRIVLQGFSADYKKNIKITNVGGQENLVNVRFPIKGTPAGRITKDGPFDRDHKKAKQTARLLAKELESELIKRISVEDSSVDEDPRGITLFVVSDAFA